MPRRFPINLQKTIGFEGPPLYFVLGGVALLVIGTFIAKNLSEDLKVEHTKRHHPKGVGYTGLNKQIDRLRNITKKVSPNLDESYYEYSRHNPSRQR